MYTSGDTVHLASMYGECRHASPLHEDTIIHLVFDDGRTYNFVHLEFMHVSTTLQSSITWLLMHMACARCIHTSGDTVHLASRYGVYRHASTSIHLASGDGYVYHFEHVEFIHVPTVLHSSTAWFQVHRVWVRCM
jgi:hypothetical protein